MIYGLVVASDMGLPDLLPWDQAGAPDITIKSGEIDWFASTNPPNLDDYVRAAPDDLMINIPDKLMMRMRWGKEITYQPTGAISDAELQAYVLGSGIGGILAQRGHLTLHASAFAPPGGSAIICLGESGAGKSTTAAAMMQRGYRVLADDICAVTGDGLIHAGLSRMKLWDETASGLGIATEELEHIPGNRAKWNVPVPAGLSDATYQPGLIILLETSASAAASATRLTGFEKFAAIRNNIYRPIFNQALRIEAACLEQVSVLGSSVEMFKLTRPQLGFETAALTQIIAELHAS